MAATSDQMARLRRRSRLDAIVEVRAEDTRSGAQQASDIRRALSDAGFTVNDLVLYSRDDAGGARGE